MFKKVLVPVDGSHAAKASFVKAVELAKLTNAELILLFVTPPQSFYLAQNSHPLTISMTHEQLVTFGLSVIDQTMGDLQVEVPVTKVVEAGNPSLHILKYIDQYAIDLVVMGTHGHGPFTGAILGSVSQKILTAAKCPVMVVKDPAGLDEQFHRIS